MSERRWLKRRLVPTLSVVAATGVLACWRGVSCLSSDGSRGVQPRGPARAPQIRDSQLEFYYRFEDLPPGRAKPVRKLNSDELNPRLIRKADELLWSRYPPVGTEIPIELEGKTYVARVETHFHEFGGAKRPWGFHRGMTLYAAK